ncbi:MAG: peptide ABC transporter substrate-binding protein, partial [Desulfobacterales bacterium]|nr:peptide ABC transporter substrate-binding protein [Desulfobacterales bacterium]
FEDDVQTLDPGMIVDMISIEVSEQLFLGLTDFDPKTYVAVPELANNWTVSDDGKTYRFDMRKDAVWTDGSPVTAHDIVWAVQRNIKPEIKSPYANMLYILKNAKAINNRKIEDVSQIGVRAIEDYLIEFTLENPASYFPAMVGLWVYRPLPRNVIQKYPDTWTETDHFVSNGSYRLAIREKGISLILRKNERYFDVNKIAIPEVRYFVIPESSVGLMLFKNDQLDILGGTYLNIMPSEISMIQSDPVLSLNLHQVPQLCTYAYVFNTLLHPVDNPLVRKAISAAIDKKILCEVLYNGNQEPATTFTRHPVFGSVDPKEQLGISFNPKQAQQWLAEAGYPDGKGFPEIELLFNTSEKHERAAKAIQTFLEHYLHIKIKLISEEWLDYVEHMKQPHTPHLVRLGWCSDYPDANNWLNELFHPTHSKNYIGWDNKEFKELMEFAQRENNKEARKKAYWRAEQILCEEECAVLPLFFEIQHFLISSRLQGWYNMALGGQHIRDWYFE